MRARRFTFANDCLTCPFRREGNFCDLPAEILRSFNEAGYLSVFPANVTLLAEGEVPRGVFVLCSGRAKLSMVGQDGKTVILNVAGGRQLLGMSAVVSGRPSAVTVTTVEYCQVKFIERHAFTELLAGNSSLAVGCAVALARGTGKAFNTLYELLLARSSAGKLARLLLSLAGNEAGNHDLQVDADFTHEEMAQMIGSSRETVTRLLGDMKRRELIRQHGATLVIPDRIALQAVAA